MSELKFSTLVRKICDYLEVDFDQVSVLSISSGRVQADYVDKKGNPKVKSKEWEQ